MDTAPKTPLFSPLALALSRHIVGPRTEPSHDCPFSLATLQEHKWHHIATPEERQDALFVAVTMIAGPLAGLLVPGAEYLSLADAPPLAPSDLPGQPGSVAPGTGGES